MSCSPHVVKSFLLGHVESGHEIHKQSISHEFCVVVCHKYNHDRLRANVNLFFSDLYIKGD